MEFSETFLNPSLHHIRKNSTKSFIKIGGVASENMREEKPDLVLGFIHF